MAKEAIEIQNGEYIDYTLTGDVSVGDVVPLGTGMIGIATTSGLAGETIALEIEDVYQIAAATADEINVGDKLYFDHTNRELTTKADSNGDGTGTPFAPAGRAVTAKAANVAGTVNVKLNQA